MSPVINIDKKDAELDNTSDDVKDIYRNTGVMAAEEYFTNMIAFGKYKNESLIEWLR